MLKWRVRSTLMSKVVNLIIVALVYLKIIVHTANPATIELPTNVTLASIFSSSAIHISESRECSLLIGAGPDSDSNSCQRPEPYQPAPNPNPIFASILSSQLQSHPLRNTVFLISVQWHRRTAFGVQNVRLQACQVSISATLRELILP